MASGIKPIEEGILHYFSGDLERALKSILKASGGRPSSESLGWEGVVLRRMGRREEALAVLQKAVRAGPECAWVHAIFGEVLREMGGRRRGYAQIQKTIQLDAESSYGRHFLTGRETRFEAWAYACRAGSLRAKGDFESARRDLIKSLDLDAGCGWAWGWLGELYLRMGRHAEAQEALNRAVALFAEWPEAFAWRGETNRLLGRDEQAMADLNHAVALGYKQYDVYLSRGSLKLSLGDGRAHLKDLKEAVRAAPAIFKGKASELEDKSGSNWIGEILGQIENGDRLLAKADQERAGQRPQRAMELLQECVKTDSGNAKAHLALSQIAAELGRNDEAMKYADEAVRLDPSSDTYSKRAVIAQKYGYMEAALRDISVSLSMSANIDLYQWRARTFLGMRHYDLALKDITSALELEPDNAELYDLRAHVNLLLGRLHYAQQDVERALRISPRHVNLHLRLGQILALRGKYEAALQSLDPIRQGSPAWAHFAAGYIDCVRKRYDLAVRQFDGAVEKAGKLDSQLKGQAAFYGTVARAFSGLKKGHLPATMDKKKEKGKVYLCGLGVYPPQTATVEVLRGISECDVIFNNLPGVGISEFLGLFCANRRPVAFRYEQDAKLCADLVLSEVKPGRTVGFVTFGHPLLFGPLSHEIIQRCARLGIACKAFGAVSSMDAVLAASGQVLGYSYGGFQLFETTGAKIIDEIASANPRLPVVIYFADGMGEQGLAHMVATLKKLYSPAHECLLYGPKHELWETQQDRVKLKDLGKIAHHKLAQGILFVPPVEKI